LAVPFDTNKSIVFAYRLRALCRLRRLRGLPASRGTSSKTTAVTQAGQDGRLSSSASARNLQSFNQVIASNQFQSSPTGQQYICICKFATADASHDCPASMHMFALHPCIPSLSCSRAHCTQPQAHRQSCNPPGLCGHATTWRGLHTRLCSWGEFWVVCVQLSHNLQLGMCGNSPLTCCYP